MKRKKTANAEQLAKRLANLDNGRDEMNLSELPFATLSDRSDGRNVLEFETEEFNHDIGQMVAGRLTVSGDPKHGLPTAKDEEIYLAQMKYSYDYNRLSDAEVHFSRSTFFELMNWPRNDWAYARLTKGMDRLVGARLHYQNIWRDNRNKQWRDRGAFSILDSYKFRDSRTVGAYGSFAEQTSRFRWGAELFESFNCGYVKRIDYGLVRSLTPAARRLYRYLGKHFYQKDKVPINLAKLAYQHIGVSRGVALDKARKRHIEPAALELEKAGFLKPCSAGRYQKLREGIWMVTFERAKARGPKVGDGSGQHNLLVTGFCDRGVSKAKAITYAASYTDETIRHAFAAFDEQIQQRVVIRKADEWFGAALERGFRPSAVRQRSSKRPELQVFRSERRRRRSG